MNFAILLKSQFHIYIMLSAVRGLITVFECTKFHLKATFRSRRILFRQTPSKLFRGTHVVPNRLTINNQFPGGM